MAKPHLTLAKPYVEHEFDFRTSRREFHYLFIITEVSKCADPHLHRHAARALRLLRQQPE